MKTLLEQAKEKKTNTRMWREITPEVMELSLAWVKGEIETASVAEVLGYRSGGQQAYTTLARALRKYFTSHNIMLTDLKNR